jgi:anti-sigma B factor antagonist
MAIKMDNKNNKSLLSIDGELTIYTANEYKKYLVGKFNSEKPLEVDLKGVEEIDTCGLQLLAAMCKQLSDNGSELKIIEASDVANEALETSRLMTDMTFITEGATHES